MFEAGSSRTEPGVRSPSGFAPGRVRSLDFKALYTGTLVDTRPDPALYERCLAAWPDARIEDPVRTRLARMADLCTRRTT